MPFVVVDTFVPAIFQHPDLRMVGQMRENGVRRFQLAEASGEGEVIFRGKSLTVKDDYEVVEQRLAYRGKRAAVDPREIQPRNLRADGRRKRPDVEWHAPR